MGSHRYKTWGFPLFFKLIFLPSHLPFATHAPRPLARLAHQRSAAAAQAAESPGCTRSVLLNRVLKVPQEVEDKGNEFASAVDIAYKTTVTLHRPRERKGRNEKTATTPTRSLAGLSKLLKYGADRENLQTLRTRPSVVTLALPAHPASTDVNLAPQRGLEPRTRWLTATCSTN